MRRESEGKCKEVKEEEVEEVEEIGENRREEPGKVKGNKGREHEGREVGEVSVRDGK